MKPFVAKPKECRQCGSMFTPWSSTQTVCGRTCANKYVKSQRAATKVAVKARKEALQTVPELKKKAQRSFNAWVRARDADALCISCGKPPGDMTQLHAGRDAGHYRSTGSADHLRFHEDNCHAQCVKCNQWDAGAVVSYRLGLIGRIGLDRVMRLEMNNSVHKWDRDELRQIDATYKAKLKALKERE